MSAAEDVCFECGEPVLCIDVPNDWWKHEFPPDDEDAHTPVPLGRVDE